MNATAQFGTDALRRGVGRRTAFLTLVAGLLAVTTACSASLTSKTPSTAATHANSPAGRSSPVTVGTTATSSRTPAPAGTGPARQPLSAVQATLAATTPGDRRVIVATNAGYQAATYAAIGNVDFWQALSPGTIWRHVGADVYPFDESLDPSGPTSANATVLANMTDATFILHGTFSTDGHANAIAYARDADGWNVIVASPDGSLAPSNDPGYDGPSYGLSFVGGNLQTEDCPPNLPMYKCGDANVVVKHWHWDGSKFLRV